MPDKPAKNTPVLFSLAILPAVLLFFFAEANGPGFLEGFEFGPSAHSMVIAGFGSLLGEAILAVNAYRKHNQIPPYYHKPGFWIVRLVVVFGSVLLPWAQGIKDAGVDRLIPFEIGLCGELLLSRIMNRE